jgi:hypothetical protein
MERGAGADPCRSTALRPPGEVIPWGLLVVGLCPEGCFVGERLCEAFLEDACAYSDFVAEVIDAALLGERPQELRLLLEPASDLYPSDGSLRVHTLAECDVCWVHETVTWDIDLRPPVEGLVGVHSFLFPVDF